MRSDEDQKTSTLGGILAEEIDKTPGKNLVGDDCNATGRSLPGTRQDPCRGHPWGHRQARAGQDSTAIPKQLLAQPAGQAPAWRRAASKPTQQAPPWWHADLCRDHKYTRSDENQKTTILSEILPRKSTRPPARSLPRMTAVPWQDPCRAPGKALDEGVSGATPRPVSTKTPPPSPSSC